MENRVNKMVFKYLDELFKDIDIQDKYFSIEVFSPGRNRTRIIQGMIGNSSLFNYYPGNNLLSFNTSELRTMVSMFGTDPKETLGYIKSYLVEHVDAIPHDVSVFGIT